MMAQTGENVYVLCFFTSTWTKSTSEKSFLKNKRNPYIFPSEVFKICINKKF